MATISDPRKLELLTAPFGPGCYQLRDGVQLLVFGMGGHVAQRMSSLCQLLKGVAPETTKANENGFLTDSAALSIKRSLAQRSKKQRNANAG